MHRFGSENMSGIAASDAGRTPPDPPPNIRTGEGGWSALCLSRNAVMAHAGSAAVVVRRATPEQRHRTGPDRAPCRRGRRSRDTRDRRHGDSLSSCVLAGERASGCSGIKWSGAGSNRRPSAFQAHLQGRWMTPDGAQCAIDLRRRSPTVAWCGLVPAVVGSPFGSLRSRTTSLSFASVMLVAETPQSGPMIVVGDTPVRLVVARHSS